MCGMKIAILVVCVCAARLRHYGDSSLSTIFTFTNIRTHSNQIWMALSGSMLVIYKLKIAFQRSKHFELAAPQTMTSCQVFYPFRQVAEVMFSLNCQCGGLSVKLRCEMRRGIKQKVSKKRSRQVISSTSSPSERMTLEYSKQMRIYTIFIALK